MKKDVTLYNLYEKVRTNLTVTGQQSRMQARKRSNVTPSVNIGVDETTVRRHNLQESLLVMAFSTFN